MAKDYFSDPNYRKPIKLNISEVDGAKALRDGWKALYGSYPSINTLSVLWAKTVLETGRFKAGFWNYNFGNIKAKSGEVFTMYDCGEELSLQEANRLKALQPHLVDIVKIYGDGKKASVNFKAGHFQTVFRAYESLEDGAKEYIRFVAEKPRYKKSFEYLKAGDPVKYSYALHEAGYYTANPKIYTAGVVRLYDEFIRKHADALKVHEIKQEIEEKVFIPESIEEVKVSTKEEESKEIELNEITQPSEIPPVEAKQLEKPINNSKESAILLAIAAAASAIYVWFTEIVSFLF